MRAWPFVVLAMVGCSGCYASHEAATAEELGECDGVARRECARRSSPCDALELVRAECVDGAWQCPSGAAPYEVPWADERCLPLSGTIDALFVDGVHEGPVAVPIGDRCVWMMPVEGDEGIGHVAVDVARSCDALVPPRTRESSVVEGGGAAWVGLSASFFDAAGEVRVLARGWTWDPEGAFGVRDVGVGFGRVRGERVVFEDAWTVEPALDLGDAAVASGDFVYAFGCPGTPEWIEEDCIVGRAPLARLDEPSAWSIFGEDGWGAGAPRRVFGAGPHRSAVVNDPRGGGFLHVYAVGFGTRLELQRATAPEGPWSEPVVLAECELPADDPGAYCAGPVVHLELFDPMRPSELVVGYSVGTTSPDGAERRARDRASYWPRVVRLAR
ncbi:MAG: DUF4185 domain-containing protein [Myxococcota bacterium]|nr:DUF4185 domain-containing protein [Myxococcota bacterium]